MSATHSTFLKQLTHFYFSTVNAYPKTKKMERKKCNQLLMLSAMINVLRAGDYVTTDSTIDNFLKENFPASECELRFQNFVNETLLSNAELESRV